MRTRHVVLGCLGVGLLGLGGLVGLAIYAGRAFTVSPEANFAVNPDAPKGRVTIRRTRAEPVEPVQVAPRPFAPRAKAPLADEPLVVTRSAVEELPITCPVPTETPLGRVTVAPRIVDRDGAPHPGIREARLAGTLLGLDASTPSGDGLLRVDGVFTAPVQWDDGGCTVGPIQEELRTAVSGTVTEPGGAPVGGAPVVSCTGAGTVTDRDGAWFLWVPAVGPCDFQAMRLDEELRFGMSAPQEVDTLAVQEAVVDLVVPSADQLDDLPPQLQPMLVVVQTLPSMLERTAVDPEAYGMTVEGRASIQDTLVDITELVMSIANAAAAGVDVERAIESGGTEIVMEQP